MSEDKNWKSKLNKSLELQIHAWILNLSDVKYLINVYQVLVLLWNTLSCQNVPSFNSGYLNSILEYT